VRHAAWHEGNSAGATDCDLLADKECDLTGEDVGDFITVMVQMKGAAGAGGNGLLENHDAVSGLAAQQFHDYRPTRRETRYRAFSWLNDDTLHAHREPSSRR
jgi:hypothetical protein